MDLNNLITPILILAVIVIIARAAIKVVPEYERGIVFRLGRVQEAKGPGIFVIIPLVDQMIRVDMRTVTMDVPTQEAITRDNVTVKVNAVCYFRVIDPVAAVVNVANARSRGRIVSSLEGGYDLEALGRSAVAHVRALQAG